LYLQHWRNGLAERRSWFIRRNGQVKGPFLSAQITRNILLGRLRPNDELSSDEHNWQQVAMHRELYPDVMQETPVDNEKVDIAKTQEDERVLEQRIHKQSMAQERRRTRDRRGDESEAMLVHRKHRTEMNDAYENSIKRPQMPILSILLMVIVIIAFGFVLTPENRNLQSDCALPPSKGVNWSNCNFIKLNAENQNLELAILTDAKLNESKLLGANLSGSNMAYAEIAESDLSYANLESVRLIGANLKHSDLRYANLKDADLSYADLSNALLAGANISNTRFDNAIWTDGTLCKKGSVGSCLSAKTK
jgi:pentapeptide repeat protein